MDQTPNVFVTKEISPFWPGCPWSWSNFWSGSTPAHGLHQRHRTRYGASDFIRGTVLLLIQHVENCTTAEMLACIECGNVFKSKKQLNNHKRIHKEAAACKECGKEMLNQNLPYHMKSKHNKDAPTYQCTECPYVTLLNNNLSRHKLVHNKENTATECEKCSKMFSRPQNMRRHMDLFHSTDKHSHCPLCEKSFTRKENLKSHMLANHATGKVSLILYFAEMFLKITISLSITLGTSIFCTHW